MILLINPITTKIKGAHYNPIGLMVLERNFNANNIKCKILDMDLAYREGFFPIEEFYDETLKQIIEVKPSWVGITSMGTNIVNVLILAERINKLNSEIKIFLGGSQVTYTYQQILRKYSYIDFICIGESDLMLESLSRYYKSEVTIDKVKKIAYKSDGRVIITENDNELISGDLILQLNRSSYFEDYSKYYDEWVAIEGGRGCPCGCRYCSTTNFWQKKFRIRNSNIIIDEMKALKKSYGFDSFSIQHDLFTCNSEYIVQFCDLIKDLNFKWNCSSRTDFLNGDLINRLRVAGCRDIFFGIETGDEITQKKINKNICLKHAREIIKLTVKNKINATASFIIGFPDEDINSIDNTLSTILEYRLIGISKCLINILIPEQGSEYFNQYKSQIKFHKDLFILNQGALMIDKDSEIEEIACNPQLYNTFYEYMNKEYSPYFLYSMKFTFQYLLKYYKLTLKYCAIVKKNGLTSIFMELLMKYNPSEYSINEVNLATKENNIHSRFEEYISRENIDLKELYKYEDVLRLHKINLNSNQSFIKLNLDLGQIVRKIRRLDSHIHYKNELGNTYLAVKSIDKQKVNIVLINAEIYYFLSSNIQEVEFKSEISELIYKKLQIEGFTI